MSPKTIINKSSKHLNIKPLTRQEIHDAIHDRLSIITREFTDGFNLIKKYPKSVTFFGSARFTETHPYYIQARSLASKISNELHYSIMTGGGPGIMEGANRGAFEVGGKSLGMTIELPNEQVTNPYLTDHLGFYYFFSRKVSMSFSAEAYIFFPGGFGTMDEFFEIITLIQTRKIERVPIILVGSDFWKHTDAFIKKCLLANDVIDDEDIDLYTITDDENEILEIIKNAPVRSTIAFEHKTLAGLSEKQCIPCEGNEKPLNHNENEKMMEEIHGWMLIDDIRIEKVFDFNDFREAMNFVNEVAKVADKENHHPDICIVNYKHVKIVLSTHAIHGLSENDFIMASKIDIVRRGEK